MRPSQFALTITKERVECEFILCSTRNDPHFITTPHSRTACSFSPLHEKIFHQAEEDAASGHDLFLYRNFAGGTRETEGGHGA